MSSEPSGSPRRAAHRGAHVDAAPLWALFEAQLQSRHLDLAQRWLQPRDRASTPSAPPVTKAMPPSPWLCVPPTRRCCTIGAVASTALGPRRFPVHAHPGRADRQRGLRRGPDLGRAAQGVRQSDLAVIPQPRRSVHTCLAPSAWPSRSASARPAPFPSDAVVVCSFGDASANHSTTVGALNAAGYCAHRRAGDTDPLRLRDNGLGISTRSPATGSAGLFPRAPASLPGSGRRRPGRLLRVAARSPTRSARSAVRRSCTFGPSDFWARGSDAELSYRSSREVLADYAKDPLLATATALIAAGAATPPTSSRATRRSEPT